MCSIFSVLETFGKNAMSACVFFFCGLPGLLGSAFGTALDSKVFALIGSKHDIKITFEV